jgi:hypothetical protein
VKFVKKPYVLLPIIWGLPWVTMLLPALPFLPEHGRLLLVALVGIVKALALALQGYLWLVRRKQLECTAA